MKKKATFLSVKFQTIFLAATFNMFVEYLLGLSDKIIAGQLLPSAALPALTLIEPTYLIIGFAGCVLCSGVGMQVSSAFGRGDRETAEKQFTQGLMLAVGLGMAIMGVYCGFSRQIVEMLGGSSSEAEYMAAYFRYTRFLPLPMLLNSVIYPIALYRGGEKYCNYSALLTVFGNIGLSLALVGPMGMEGIGLGSVVGSWAGFFPLVCFLRTERGYMKLRPHFSPADIRSMGVYSVGDSIIYFYIAVFQFCMNLFLLHRFGGAAVVVFTGVINLMGMFASLSDGICEFLLSMINMYRGEENVIGERNTMLTTLKAGVVEALVLMVLIWLSAGVIASLMGVTEPVIRSDFIRAMRIYAAAAPFFYVLNIYAQYYLYIGRIRFSLTLSLFMNLVFPLLCSLLGGMVPGMNGVWIGMAAAYPLLTVCAWVLLSRNEAADGLCMFPDREKMACQHCWDVEMTEEGIGYLMDSAEAAMVEKGISRSRINRVLLAIEETQMDDLLQNRKGSRVRIECTLYLEDQITLVLHNTGVSHNAVDANGPMPEENRPRYHILSSMQSKTYIMVNGTNRLIFRF